MAGCPDHHAGLHVSMCSSYNLDICLYPEPSIHGSAYTMFDINNVSCPVPIPAPSSMLAVVVAFVNQCDEIVSVCVYISCHY